MNLCVACYIGMNVVVYSSILFLPLNVPLSSSFRSLFAVAVVFYCVVLRFVLRLSSLSSPSNSFGGIVTVFVVRSYLLLVMSSHLLFVSASCLFVFFFFRYTHAHKNPMTTYKRQMRI